MREIRLPDTGASGLRTRVAHEGGFDLGPLPSVRAWLDRVRDRPDFTPITQP